MDNPLGNSTGAPSGWLSCTLDAFGSLAPAAAPIVTAVLPGRNNSNQPTTSQTAANATPLTSRLGSMFSGYGAPILIGGVLIVAVLGFVLFRKK